jgi:hypothetical protein
VGPEKWKRDSPMLYECGFPCQPPFDGNDDDSDHTHIYKIPLPQNIIYNVLFLSI